MFHIFFCCERVGSIKLYCCCAGCVVLVKTTQLVNERREVCRCAHIRQTKYDPQNRISMLVDCVETKAGRVALLPTWALIGFEWFWWAISCEYRMIRRDDCSEVLDFFYSHTIKQQHQHQSSPINAHQQCSILHGSKKTQKPGACTLRARVGNPATGGTTRILGQPLVGLHDFALPVV